MDLKRGHKSSDLGTIPEDWNVITLGSLNPFITSGSRGWAKYYSESGAPFIRITNLSRMSIYPNLSDLKFVQLPPGNTEGARTQLKYGDLLISITADIGISGFADNSIPSPAYINQHIALVRVDPDKSDAKFLSYYLASEAAQRVFSAGTDQGAKAGMNLPGIRAIKTVFPSLKEQHRIATALSDMDALLAAIDDLIIKKRNTRQGATQSLLSGRTRLPGFGSSHDRRQSQVGLIPQDWKAIPLHGLSWMKSGENITATSIDQTSTFPCFGGNGLRGYTTRFTHDGDFALIGRQGALCGNVLGVSGRFFASEHAIVVTALPGTDISWLTLVLGNMHLNRYSESSAQPGLSVKKIASLMVATPPTKAEQAAIAAVLSDMDAELTALEQRRDKTRLLKQGMMQELLTGRTRLV